MSISGNLRAALRVALGRSSATSELLRILGLLDPSGTTYYVSSVLGSSGYDGLSWASPKATLAQAIALCTADRGDIIQLGAGHAETIVGAAGSGITKAGVRVIGHGVGRQRPTFTFTTAAGASFDITAARCSIENCCFVNGIDAQTAMVNISAADVVIEECEFHLGTLTTPQALLGILTTAAADRAIIRRNHMHGCITAGNVAAIRIVGGDAILIEDNIITGEFALTGCISNITTAATMLVIRRNNLLNRAATADNKVIVADASTTGLIVNNSGGLIDAACPIPVTAAGMHVGSNYWSSAAGVTASVLM